MKRAERARLWAKHMRGWKTSGLTQRAYCEREAISYDVFKHWRQRLRGDRDQSESPARFVPVSVQSEAAPRPRAQVALGEDRVGRGVSRGVEVRLASGRSVVLDGAFDEVELGRLIRLLEVLPC